MSLMRLRGASSGTPTLQALALDNATAVDTVTSPTQLANILNKTASSVITTADARIAINGASTAVLRGLGAWVDGATTFSLVETLAGAVGSPKTTSIPFTILAPGTFPTLAAAVPWTGTAGTGGTAPTDPTRTTQKPACRPCQDDRQTLRANTVVGVKAYDPSGIAGVDFWFEGTTVTVSTPSLYSYTDVNGASRTELGYWINLNILDAVTRHPLGEVIWCATARPVDGTKQNRVMTFKNWVNVPGYDFIYKIQPSAGVNTPTASGGTFISLDAVIAQYKLDQPTGTVQWLCTENQTVTLSTNATQVITCRGRVDFMVSPGFTATLQRGTGFVSVPSFTPGSWSFEYYWMPLPGCLNFVGAGIVIDVKWWSTLIDFLGSGSLLPKSSFNGVTITNSLGRDQKAWNKSPGPGFGTEDAGFGATQCFYKNCTVRGVNGGPVGFLVGCNFISSMGNHDQLGLIADHYEYGSDPRYFTVPIDAINVVWTGAGTLTIIPDPNTNKIDAKINGVSVGGLFPLAFTVNSIWWQYPNDPYYQISAITSALNTITGVAATTLDSTSQGYGIVDGGVTLTFTNSTPQTMKTVFLHHTEWQHFSSTPVENVIFENCVANQCVWLTAPLNFGANGNDCAIVNCSFNDAVISGVNGGINGQNILVTGCYFNSPFQIDPTNIDNKSLVQNNVFGLITTPPQLSTPPWANVTIKDNAYVTFLPTVPGTGNFAITSVASNVVNAATNDLRPTSTVAATTKTRVFTAYDTKHNVLAIPDAVGPFANAAPSPLPWPT